MKSYHHNNYMILIPILLVTRASICMLESKEMLRAKPMNKVQRCLNWIEDTSRPAMNKIVNSKLYTKTCDWFAATISNVYKSCPSYFNENASRLVRSEGTFEVSLVKIDENDSPVKRALKKTAAIAFCVNALLNISAPALKAHLNPEELELRKVGSDNPEKNLVDILSTYVNVPEAAKNNLYSMANSNKKFNRSVVEVEHDIPLFRAFPNLNKQIPYVSFCNLPTPITDCNKLAKKIKVSKFYVKRDDLTGKKIAHGMNLFGGNKPRKLEFMLADALAHDTTAVLTFGCAGSNHALATAIYAKELGLKSILMLKPQQPSKIIRRNLLLGIDAGADITFSNTNNLRGIAAITKFFTYKNEHGTFPYVIPTGASCPIGSLGFVNAIIELQEQINAGIIQQPTKIYLPVGSAGTFAGVLVGAKAIGFKSKIIGVTVEPEEVANEFVDKIHDIFGGAVNLLRIADRSFPKIALNKDEINLIYDSCGNDYALFTEEGVDAIKLLYDVEGIKLDGVYTGKAFAGLLKDLNRSTNIDETILFWNTFSGDSFEETIKDVDYHKLPSPFHTYFEDEVQPLDRN